jgi:hypothetical protein
LRSARARSAEEDSEDEVARSSEEPGGDQASDPFEDDGVTVEAVDIGLFRRMEGLDVIGEFAVDFVLVPKGADEPRVGAGAEGRGQEFEVFDRGVFEAGFVPKWGRMIV